MACMFYSCKCGHAESDNRPPIDRRCLKCYRRMRAAFDELPGEDVGLQGMRHEEADCDSEEDQ